MGAVSPEESEVYQIEKRFAFSASHQLITLPPDHQCSRLHGHNYAVIVTLESHDLNEHGFVVDYGDLAPFAQLLKEKYDHRHLNDLMVTPPTAENLARLFWYWCVGRWPQVIAVSVSETENTWARYQP